MIVKYGKGFAVAKSMLEKVQALEDELLKMPQAGIVTTHTFKPGIYERTITIPPWTVLTGAEHKTEYTVRCDQGRISVNTDDGIKMITAPYEFKAPAGVKRAGMTFEEECIWTDVYPNADDETDIDVLEARLYVIPPCGLGENRVKLEKIATCQAPEFANIEIQGE